MAHTFFGKRLPAKCTGSEALATPDKFAGGAVKREIISNQKSAEELHKKIIWKFEN